MTSTHYDVVVIGAGSGNMILGAEFADQRVAICQDGPFGGTCLNVGCIPTKMFVYPADISREAADGPRLGVRTTTSGADWPEIRDRIFGRIDQDAAGAQKFREGQPNVDVHLGTVRFTGPRTLLTEDGQVLTADQIVIATGSRAVIPDIPGLADVETHTSDTIMRLSALPDRIGIIGGGYIAAEFAHVFSGFGSRVTQIARGPALLTAQDDDISARFTERAAAHWDVRLGTQAERVQQRDTGIALHLDDGTQVEVDVLLVATGRVPNTRGLEESGVERHPDGRIRVDEQQRTSVPGVWALGDVCNDHMLKHVANHEAKVVRHNLRHPDDLIGADHRFIPSAVFTHPQIASVGLTERAAAERLAHPVAVTQEYADVAFGWAMEDTQHFVKLVGDRDTGRLVGAHLIGPQASTLIQPLLLAMSLDLPVAGLSKRTYWIHPALTEVVENALIKLERALR